MHIFTFNCKLLSGLQPNRAICERFAIRHVKPQTRHYLLIKRASLFLSLTVFAVKFLFSDPPYLRTREERVSKLNNQFYKLAANNDRSVLRYIVHVLPRFSLQSGRSRCHVRRHILALKKAFLTEIP